MIGRLPSLQTPELFTLPSRAFFLESLFGQRMVAQRASRRISRDMVASARRDGEPGKSATELMSARE